MSVGPTPSVLRSAMGVPLAQSKGSEIDRGQVDAINDDRRVESDLMTDGAAGVGATDQDRATDDRDPDPRRTSQESATQESSEEAANKGTAPDPVTSKRYSRDATGERGKRVDLSG